MDLETPRRKCTVVFATTVDEMSLFFVVVVLCGSFHSIPRRVHSTATTYTIIISFLSLPSEENRVIVSRVYNCKGASVAADLQHILALHADHRHALQSPGPAC